MAKSLLKAKSIYEVVYEQKTPLDKPWGKRYVTYFSNLAHAKMFWRQKKSEGNIGWVKRVK